MSKNTSSNAFRKIDVDQFNEDNFKDEETPQDAGFAGVNESEVSNLLSKGNAGEALKLLLSSAPIGSKNQADKVCLLSKLGDVNDVTGKDPWEGWGHFTWKDILKAKMEI